MIIENYNELLAIMLQSLLVFVVYYTLYKKYIYSLFDPLLFFLITQAFSTELAIIEITENWYLINFITCQILFTSGFLLYSKSIRNKNRIIDSNFYISENNLSALKIFCYIGFLIIIAGNMLFFFQKGIILFSDDPSMSKVTDFEGGMGFVKRINWGLLPLISLISIFLLIYLKELKFILILLSLVLITISGGGKGTILIYLYIVSILGLFNNLSKINYYKYLGKFKIPIGLVGILIAFYIFSTKSEDFEKTIIAAGIRFLYFGDIILYYYQSDSVKHFQQLGIIDFLSREFNSILGLLRLTEYTNPIGYEMVIYSLTSEQLNTITGPNAPFYVKGHIFFGAYGALIYSFFVGGFVGYIRKLLFSLNNQKKNYIHVLILIFLNVNIFGFPQDSALFISIVFDTLLFSIIPIIISFIIVKKRI